jgi:hypothetical protein
MAESLSIDDQALLTVGASLVSIASTMVSGNAARPAGDLPSLSGIGAEVTLYLQGVNVARAALADAARTASEAVSELLSDGSELDRYIAESLGSGFAVRGAG